MNQNTIFAQIRQPSGKGGARQARIAGMIPGVYYAHNEENIHFVVPEADLSKLLRRRQTIVILKLGDGEDVPCVIRELQRDPVDDHFLHIDLLGVHSGERIHVTVPVRLNGIAIGVKDEGGILEHGLTQLSIECLPSDIPEVVNVDVTALRIGNSIHLSDLSLPNIRLLDDPKTMVAHIASPTVLKEPTPETELLATEGEGAGEETTQEPKK